MVIKLGTLRPPLARLLELLRARTDITVWLLAVAATAALLGGQVQSYDYTAIARARNFEVSPAAAGVIKQVTVELYERVDAGDMIAVLDDSGVRARLATATAVLDGLSAELVSAEAVIERGVGPGRLDWRNQLRRFEVDVERLKLDGLTIEVAIESDKVEKQRLALALARMADLREAGIVSPAEYDDARLAHRQIAERLDRNRALSEETSDEQRAAVARKLEFERNLPGKGDNGQLLAPWKAAVATQQRRLAEIRLERERLILRAPVAGQVSQVLALPGQSILAGQTVATITPRFATEVVGYLPEHNSHFASAEAPVRISSLANPSASSDSYVLRVSPSVEVLPERLRRRPDRLEYGRAFIVAIPYPLDILPGEAVGVRFKH
ncbi:MAG: HlyD family efflux transporter periplasmic adaptor subunit [Deltaproteobacteria bacterium]